MQMKTIYTDANGKPFEKPEAPAIDADIETKVKYMREMCAWRDAITSCGSAAFAQSFCRAVSK